MVVYMRHKSRRFIKGSILFISHSRCYQFGYTFDSSPLLKFSGVYFQVSGNLITLRTGHTSLVAIRLLNAKIGIKETIRETLEG